MIAKKSIETGEDYDLIPESMRQYLMQTESGKGLGLDRGMGYGNNLLMTPEPSSGKIGMAHPHLILLGQLLTLVS